MIMSHFQVDFIQHNYNSISFDCCHEELSRNYKRLSFNEKNIDFSKPTIQMFSNSLIPLQIKYLHKIEAYSMWEFQKLASSIKFVYFPIKLSHLLWSQFSVKLSFT